MQSDRGPKSLQFFTCLVDQKIWAIWRSTFFIVHSCFFGWCEKGAAKLKKACFCCFEASQFIWIYINIKLVVAFLKNLLEITFFDWQLLFKWLNVFSKLSSKLHVQLPPGLTDFSIRRFRSSRCSGITWWIQLFIQELQFSTFDVHIPTFFRNISNKKPSLPLRGSWR